MPARILHLADLHIDTGPNGRTDDTMAALDRATALVRAAASTAAPYTAVIVAGDLYERRSLPEERNLAVRWLRDIADHVPVLIVHGNHEVPGDLRILGALDTTEAVEVAEEPTIWTVRDHATIGVPADVEGHSLMSPMPFRCIGEAPTVVVFALPWPRRSLLLAGEDAPRTIEETNARVTGALNALMLGFKAIRDQCRAAWPKTPIVLAGHVNVTGAKVSTGQTMVGTEVEVGWQDLEEVGADYVALGHIHKRQAFGPGSIWYCGSPTARNFGEPEDDKGGIDVMFDVGKDKRIVVGTTPIVLQAHRLITVQAEFMPPHGFVLHTENTVVGPGDEVRVVYAVDAEQRTAARAAEAAASASLCHDAVVRFEPDVRARSSVRAAAIAAATTIKAKVKAYWDATGQEADPTRRGRLIEKLARLADAE